MPVYLKDLRDVPTPDSRVAGDGREAFFQHPKILALGWPEEVIAQWLWEHSNNPRFLKDYGTVDLSNVAWSCEAVPVGELETMQTGPSDPGVIEQYADRHEYALEVRRHLPNIVDTWTNDGTWAVPPILISCKLLMPSGEGLQVIEGRTRVGVLRGRRRDGLHVADQHKAWVGRPRDMESYDLM